jgi:hypothetical protein
MGAKVYGNITSFAYEITCPYSEIVHNECGVYRPPYVTSHCTDDSSESSSCCFVWDNKQCYKLNYKVDEPVNVTKEFDERISIDGLDTNTTRVMNFTMYCDGGVYRYINNWLNIALLMVLTMI